MNIEGARILLTGASGFIGANLARRLLDSGAEVCVFIRGKSNLWRLDEIYSQLKVFTADITDKEAVHTAARTIHPDIIFHLATCRASASAEERSATLQTNVIGTVNVLEAATSVNCQRVIYVGGSLEYGPKPHPLRESDLTVPNTFYGASKAASTIICQQFVQATNLPIMLLRPFSVYGYWEGPARLIPTAIMRTFDNGVLLLTPPGYRRDLVFVEDVVDALLLAARSESVSGEIINIGSGEQWANEEVVDMIEHITGKKINLQVGEFRAKASDTGYWVADNGKARQFLGWEPSHDLQEGLKKTIEWFSRHKGMYMRATA